MPRDQLGQLFCNLFPDLAIFRGLFRREAAIAGDTPKAHPVGTYFPARNAFSTCRATSGFSRSRLIEYGYQSRP